MEDQGAIDEFPDLLTVQEVAVALRASPRAVRNLCSRGKLPCVKVGGTWRIYRQQLLDRLTET